MDHRMKESKVKLRYVGKPPYRMIINDVINTLNYGDEVTVNLHKIKVSKLHRFINITEKEKKDKPNKALKDKLKDMEKRIKALEMLHS